MSPPPKRAGIDTCTVVADALLPISVSAHLRFSFKPIVKIAPIFICRGVRKARRRTVEFSPQLARQIQPVAVLPRVVGAAFSLRRFLRPYERLVLTFACKLVQDKLLRQTAADMQSHANPKTFEYTPSTAIRLWVVSGGNGR